MNLQRGVELNWGPFAFECHPVSWVPPGSDAQACTLLKNAACENVVMDEFDTLVFCLKRRRKRKEGKKEEKKLKWNFNSINPNQKQNC